VSQVLITGCSTGIGKACALHMARRDWTVFAGVRRLSDAESLRKDAPDVAAGIIPTALDVTDPVSIRAAAEQISRATGSAGLAALVNNAGISVNGPVEFVPIDEWRRQFEVNFLGHIAVTQAMLPLLRTYANATPGPRPARIVMMSSIAGRFAQPILGPYCSSKFALEAMSDALRRELRAQRIGVSIVQPGAIQSEIWRKALDEVAAQDRADPALQPYEHLVAGITVAASEAELAAVPAARVARVVERCLTARTPPIRVLVGTDAKLLAAAKAILPTRMIDALLEFGLRRVAKQQKKTPA
jgi:NAD(P)-dependent dehydrogenase (short-subunit alcohol dehydrogenase family)